MYEDAYNNKQNELRKIHATILATSENPIGKELSNINEITQVLSQTDNVGDESIVKKLDYLDLLSTSLIFDRNVCPWILDDTVSPGPCNRCFLHLRERCPFSVFLVL